MSVSTGGGCTAEKSISLENTTIVNTDMKSPFVLNPHPYFCNSAVHPPGRNLLALVFEDPCWI
jgi:hypothetical protein